MPAATAEQNPVALNISSGEATQVPDVQVVLGRS